MNKAPQIACYGEILWDVFPDEKLLGGAPLNVALRLHSLGANINMISGLGHDNLAEKTLATIQDYGLHTSLVQKIDKYPTGQVTVTLDSSGSASYEIEKNAAWDCITATLEAQKAVQDSEAFVFGSLACRETYNLNELKKLIDKAKYSIFDLNLRAPHYTQATILELMQRAHLIKMNDEELELVIQWMHISAEHIEEQLSALSRKLNHKNICVTLGDKGAILWHEGTIYRHQGYPCSVVDTVGAGDSFLAGLIYGLFSNQTPQQALELGCALGSLVAGKAGANAIVSEEEIKNLCS